MSVSLPGRNLSYFRVCIFNKRLLQGNNWTCGTEFTECSILSKPGISLTDVLNGLSDEPICSYPDMESGNLLKLFCGKFCFCWSSADLRLSKLPKLPYLTLSVIPLRVSGDLSWAFAHSWREPHDILVCLRDFLKFSSRECCSFASFSSAYSQWRSWWGFCVVSEEGILKWVGGLCPRENFSFSSPKQWGFVKFRLQERQQHRKTVAGWETEDIF